MNISNILLQRAIRCPRCGEIKVLSTDVLDELYTCRCSESFLPYPHLVTSAPPDGHSPYSMWCCVGCGTPLLVPELSLSLPAKCPCGQKYPLFCDRRVKPEYVLEPATDSYFALPYADSTELLASYNAARRYTYDIESIASGQFSIFNPTKKTTYTVRLSDEHGDHCTCDTFTGSRLACIHTEYVRMVTGMASLSKKAAESDQVAFAWFDRTCLPPRIRVGVRGSTSILKKVTDSHPLIRSLSDIRDLRRAFEKRGIPLVIDYHVGQCLKIPEASPVDDSLKRKILECGSEFLKSCCPELRDYQIDGAVFLAAQQRAILLDEMGLGKTAQAIAAARLLFEFSELRSCLILSPKSVIPHWIAEAKKFADEPCVEVGGHDLARAPETHGRRFCVTTLESFRKHRDHLCSRDLLICDEVHKVRNQSTVSHTAVQSYRSKYFFGLSGTAMEQSLEDLYTILRAARIPNLESSFEFHVNHCVSDAFGRITRTQLPELFFIKHSDTILRRTKDKVESEILPVQVQQVVLPLTAGQQAMEAPLAEELKEVGQRLKARYDANDFIRMRWLVHRLAELADSTELLGSDKPESSKLDWLSGFLGSKVRAEGERVVIFTRWTRMQIIIARLCESLNLPYVTLSGSDSGDKRNEAIERFRDDPEIRVFISTDAGGVGVNLEFARCVVLVEPSWNPSSDLQRIQRLHRIGQAGQVVAYHLETALDHLFVISTHARKSFSANRLEEFNSFSADDPMPDWGEIVAVIQQYRHAANAASSSVRIGETDPMPTIREITIMLENSKKGLGRSPL